MCLFLGGLFVVDIGLMPWKTGNKHCCLPASSPTHLSSSPPSSLSSIIIYIYLRKGQAQGKAFCMHFSMPSPLLFAWAGQAGRLSWPGGGLPPFYLAFSGSVISHYSSYILALGRLFALPACTLWHAFLFLEGGGRRGRGFLLSLKLFIHLTTFHACTHWAPAFHCTSCCMLWLCAV